MEWGCLLVRDRKDSTLVGQLVREITGQPGGQLGAIRVLLSLFVSARALTNSLLTHYYITTNSLTNSVRSYPYSTVLYWFPCLCPSTIVCLSMRCLYLFRFRGIEKKALHRYYYATTGLLLDCFLPRPTKISLRWNKLYR